MWGEHKKLTNIEAKHRKKFANVDKNCFNKTIN